jgi:hypothetical protein
MLAVLNAMNDGYIKIYSTLNIAEAHMIAFLLENNGIEAVIENEDMTPLFGMVPAKDAEARIWVPESRYGDATRLVSSSSTVDISGKNMARCKRCGELVCDIFDYCWNCMADMETGEEYRGARAAPDEAAGKRPRWPVLLYAFLAAAFLTALAFFAYEYFR